MSTYTVFNCLHRFGSNLRRVARTYSSKSTRFSVLPPNQIHFTKDENEEFLSLYPQILQDVINIEPYNRLPYLMSKMEIMMNYNLTYGYNSSGLMTIYSYKMIEKAENRSEENLRQAILLGWCMRFFEASTVVLDDFLDNSVTRNGCRCWYSIPEIGKKAAVHAQFFEICKYYILRKYFSTHPRYLNFQQIFLEAAYCLTYSQCLDTLPLSEEYMTAQHENAISTGVAQYTSYYPCIALAMYLANLRKPELYDQVKKVTSSMGKLYQMENDYLDVFDNSGNLYVKSDIKMGRITWLSMNAFNRCTTEQKRLFLRLYGNTSKESVQEMIILYNELGMVELYDEVSKKLKNQILDEIESVPNDVIPHEMFYRFLKQRAFLI